MITLHRLGHEQEPFTLNADLIATVEAHPDTVVTLTSGSRMVVAESPEQVVEAVRTWRTSILAGGLRGAGGTSVVRRNPNAGLALVRGASGEPPTSRQEGQS